MYVIFGINTTCDISKLSQILKYHSWYLCQISLQIMLLPILSHKFFNYDHLGGYKAKLITVQTTFLRQGALDVSHLKQWYENGRQLGSTYMHNANRKQWRPIRLAHIETLNVFCLIYSTMSDQLGSINLKIVVQK